MPLLFFVLMSSCSSGRLTNTGLQTDSVHVDSIYSRGTWNQYFRAFKTPVGVTIQLKVTSDSDYCIQWGDSGRMKTFPQRLQLDGHTNWLPHFVGENKDYVVLKQVCGNPCWSGYFLPLKDSLLPQRIDEYLAYDLDNHLVASMNDTNVIQIRNLKTNMTENHMVNGCTSSFPGYCMDSVSFEGRIIKYKLMDVKHSNGTFIKVRIKI